jgi:hypothetical protein
MDDDVFVYGERVLPVEEAGAELGVKPDEVRANAGADFPQKVDSGLGAICGLPQTCDGGAILWGRRVPVGRALELWALASSSRPGRVAPRFACLKYVAQPD